MGNWVTILRFDMVHEAHMAKTKLESEGIKAIVENELSGQVYNIIRTSDVIKLCVHNNDYEQAFQILKESGYIKDSKTENKLLTKLDKITSKIPLLGKTIFEFRLIILVTILIVLMSLPFIL